MNTKVICLFLALIAASAPTDVGMTCKDKEIINFSDNSLTYGKYSDYDRVYHGVASCYSLATDGDCDDCLCCYIKNHFKSEEADKKFTHKGCIPVSLDVLKENGLGSFINSLEDGIEQNDETIRKVDIDIDCNSNFIKLTGLLLLAFLL